MNSTSTLINGRYRLDRMIGSGGMGTVYAAHDQRLGRAVALKILSPHIAADPKARERFVREAQIAAQLIHPHIVRTYDAGDAPEGLYLVQELLHGDTLDLRLPLPPQQAITVTRQIADALAAIHDRGYVHCDIKPQNIMVQGSADRLRAILLDFGIARLAGADTTALIATPLYLAPERTTGAAPTAASDLYALGIVLYHMLTGHPPFDAPTVHALIEQHRTAPLPPLTIAAPEAAALEAIIRRLTAKQPADRYRSAAALRDDLDALQHNAIHQQPTIAVASHAQAPRAAVPPPVTTPARSGGSRGLRLLLLPLIAVAVLLVSSLALNRGAPNAETPALAPVLSPSNIPGEPTSVPLITIPAIVGLPVDQARHQIEASGLVFQLGESVQTDQPAGLVIETRPAVDQQVAPGSIVIVNVSNGPPAAATTDDQNNDTANNKDDDEDNNGKKNDNGNRQGKGKDKKDD